MTGLWAMGMFAGGVLRRRRRWRRWSPEYRLAQSSLLSEDESRQLPEQAEPLSVVPFRSKKSTTNCKGRNGERQAILQP
jgi:hypothetical protein